MELWETPDLSDAAVEALTHQRIDAGGLYDHVMLHDLKFIKKDANVKVRGFPMDHQGKFNDPARLIEIEISLPLWLIQELEVIASELDKSVAEILVDACGIQGPRWAIPSWLLKLRKLAIGLPSSFE